jgi:hypothetical protein
MKQILRKGLKDIVVDDVPDPLFSPHHVLIRPIYSLISSGSEAAGIDQEGVLKAVADNPSQLSSASHYSEIPNDPEIQEVVIVSRNQQHASQALAALPAGKHVFVEKPMALAQEECRELYQAVEETGKQLTVGFNRRFAPQIAKRNGPAVLNCRVYSPAISGSYWMADPAAGGAILGEACAAQKQGRPPDVTVRDGVRSTLGCLLMMQSAREHAPCSIDLEDFLAPSPR